MNLKINKSIIYIAIVVVVIGGYSIWVNILGDTVSKGDSFVCSDILEDKYTISVSEIEYKAGTMTVDLSIDYDLKDNKEETDKEKVKAAINVFLALSAYLESNGIAYKPTEINTETNFDFTTDKWATAELCFLVDDDKDYTLNIKSDYDLIKFALK